MVDDSAISKDFNFNKKDGDEPKQNVPVEEVPAPVKTSLEQDEERLNEEYIDTRSVTIGLVRNYSKFREANRSTLPKRVDYIGSCINSSKKLAANKEEMAAYYPQLIGISSSDPDFVRRVKVWLNNIQVKVDELGKTFDTTFIYNRYRDYLKIAKQEEAIENRYKLANRSNAEELEKALKRKIDDIHALESTKFKYGHPVNVEDYLIYRHCLLYNDIAKDEALINSNAGVRFYFKDDKKEVDRLKKFRGEVNKAKANYVACLADEKLFEAVYIQYLSASNLPITPMLLEDEVTKQSKLDKYSQDEPVKFNKFCKDPDVKLKSTIELLVARGIIIKSPYNQNMTTDDGTLIGANMQEVVAWFKDPLNTPQVEAYYNQLRNI